MSTLVFNVEKFFSFARKEGLSMSAEKQIFHETKGLSLAANGLLDVMLNLPDRDYLTAEELCLSCGNEPFSQIKAELDELMKAQFVICVGGRYAVRKQAILQMRTL